MAEQFGLAGREKLYETLGALRDVVQNHMLQVLAMIAMEEPVASDAESIRNARTRILRSLKPLTPDGCSARPVRRLSRSKWRA